MTTRLQLIVLVILACMVYNTGGQEILGKYFENLKRNMEYLNKEKAGKVEYDYPDDDYIYDDTEDYKPTPKSPSANTEKGKARDSKKGTKSDSDAGGGYKKAPGPRKEEREVVKSRPPPPKPAPRAPAERAPVNRAGVDSDEPDTLKVLTVKKFMFQAQPVTPAGTKNPEMAKIYYYI